MSDNLHDHVKNASKFGKDYFVNSDTSNYEDYRIRKFDNVAVALIKLLELNKDNSILDFGCANGGLLSCFKERGITKIKGTDISMWSIDYGIQQYGLDHELEYYNINLLREGFDVLIMLDVLEHVPNVQTIEQYMKLSNAEKVVIRLPISAKEGKPYVFPVSRNDKTHIQCHTKKWWIDLFKRCNYVVDEYIQEKPAIWDSEGVLSIVLKRLKNE